MATIAASHTETSRTGFWAILASMGNAFVRMGENHPRMRKVEYLNGLSDAELAKRGLRREDIVRHVFKDTYHI